MQDKFGNEIGWNIGLTVLKFIKKLSLERSKKLTN